MEYYFNLNINEVMNNITSAEVITLYFPYLSKTMILDLRHSEDDMPLVRLVPMVDNMEERFRSLKKLRPRFPKPEAITVIPWPKYVRNLQSLGVYEKIVERLMQLGYPSVVNDFCGAYDELVKMDAKNFLPQSRARAIRLFGKRKRSNWNSLGEPVNTNLNRDIKKGCPGQPFCVSGEFCTLIGELVPHRWISCGYSIRQRQWT